MDKYFDERERKWVYPQTWRTKWKATGKLIATYSNEYIAKFMFEMAEKSYPGEVVLEEIPTQRPKETNTLGYGRDEIDVD